MTHQANGNGRAVSGAWRWMSLLLLAALAGMFVARAQSDVIEGPRNLEVLVQPAEGPGTPATVQPAQPAVRAVAAGGVVQPSSSVEATALAIAYHALRSGDAKVTPEAVGKFAADMMNAFSAARK